MKLVRPIKIGDANLVSSNVPENDYPAYSPATGYSLGNRVTITTGGLHKVYESLRGASSTVTISYASPAIVGWVLHGLAEGTAVTLSTTGSLPAGLATATTYYVRNPTTNTFQLAATLGGAVINTSSAGSGTHTCSEALNQGNDPTTRPDYWLDCGATNRWKMFDQSVQSQTTATTTLTTTVATTSYIDTIALLNLTGTSARITATHATFGVVYDKTISLSSPEYAVTDWLSYFMAGFLAKQDVLFEGIPPYTNLNVTLTITAPVGTPAACGAWITGLAKDISADKLGPELGAKLGIQDYSVKTQDDFGNFTILERAFANRADFTIRINNTDLDYIQNLLASYRATPIVYIGSNGYGSTIVYGFYKTFDIEISYHKYSICTIQLEGLT